VAYTPSDETAYRFGATALGMLAGMVLGVALIALGFATGGFLPSIPLLVFGGGAVGALTGLFFPAVAMLLAEGAAHFVIGAASVVSDEPVFPERDAPRWLVAAFFFGGAYAVVLWWFT